MALTKVSGGILDPGISVAGIVTATGFSGPFIGGGGVNAGIVTATGLDVNGNGDISGTLVVGNIGGTPTFTGDVNFNGNVSIAQTLTYSDVTNIDSVGIVTARQGVRVTADGSTSANYISVGASNDFKIYHTGNHTHLDNDTGHITVTANQINLNNQDNSENCLQCIGNAEVRLFHNGAKKFETTSTGAKIDSGQLHIESASATTNDLDMLVIDGGSTGFSGGNDANTEYGIQFKGCSFSTGTGIQQRVGSQILMRKEGTWNGHSGGGNRCDTTIAFTNSTGLFTNGTLAQVDRLLINSDGNVQIPNDTGKLQLGASQDLQLFHNGSHSYIDNLTGGLYIRPANDFFVQNRDTGEVYLKGIEDGAVELYYNNTLRLETRTNDVKFHGGLVAVDNVKLQLGSSGDLQLFHDGFHSYVSDPIGIGNLRIRVNTGQVELQPKIGEYGLICKPAGAVELYHNNSRVVKTNTYGLQVGLKAVNDDNNHVATIGWALADDWTKVVFDGSVAGNSPLTIRNQNATYNRYMCYFKFDGGFANYSANDINLCDERVKKDFADVSSQWNNIKNIGFKHFRYKEDSSSEPLKIGVVAQQIETVYPDLIDESWPQDDANPNTGEGTFYKGVKEEQLLMYAVKALQEAQARIETLEAEVAALKGS